MFSVYFKSLSYILTSIQFTETCGCFDLIPFVSQSPSNSDSIACDLSKEIVMLFRFTATFPLEIIKFEGKVFAATFRSSLAVALSVWLGLQQSRHNACKTSLDTCLERRQKADSTLVAPLSVTSEH